MILQVISLVCSVEDQKKVFTTKSIAIYSINYFFDYSVHFIRVTDCSIRVSRSFNLIQLIALQNWKVGKYNKKSSTNSEGLPVTCTGL